MQPIPTDHLWPGCVAEVETQPLDESDPWYIANAQSRYISKITLSHPESPITLVYTYDRDEHRADIDATGLLKASNRDVQMILPVLTRLRGLVGKQDVRTAYDEAYRRILAGEDWDSVKGQFIETFGVSSKAFNAAMYRRRQQEAETN